MIVKEFFKQTKGSYNTYKSQTGAEILKQWDDVEFSSGSVDGYGESQTDGLHEIPIQRSVLEISVSVALSTELSVKLMCKSVNTLV